MRFTKMQGAGNDYIYFNCFKECPQAPQALAVRLSDRHFGIGGDGIVLIMPSETADVRMRMFNADGSEGNMCGNAIRCVAKYAYQRGICQKTEMDVETRSGVKHLFLDVESGAVKSVRVDMGRAVFQPEAVPVKSKKPVINKPLSIKGRQLFSTVLSMGNPHCVMFVENADEEELQKLGQAIEKLDIFPEGVNAEFITVTGERSIKMRVWERGSGETWACGTGACASVAACVVNGIMNFNEDITVKMKGGELVIRVCEDYSVFMTGPAEFVFEGEID